MAKIEWTYSHALNSVARTLITKRGEFLGKVRHTMRHWRKATAVQMAVVQFDGNKTPSIVPFDELSWVKSAPQQPGTDGVAMNGEKKREGEDCVAEEVDWILVMRKTVLEAANEILTIIKNHQLLSGDGEKKREE